MMKFNFKWNFRKKLFQNSLLERQGSIILIGLIVLYTLFSIQFVSAFGYGTKISRTITHVNVTSATNLNSSNYWDDLDVPTDISGSEFWYNQTTGITTWVTANYVPYTGATSNVDLNSRKLTGIGELIVEGLTTSQDIFPVTHNLYSLGNSTNWFKELFVKTIYANVINTTNLTSTNIKSEYTNTTNLTVGGYNVYKDGGGDLNIGLD